MVGIQLWKTGHSLIKQKMTEIGCKFGGEMSGHIFFADDYYGYDDASMLRFRVVRVYYQKQIKAYLNLDQLFRYTFNARNENGNKK